MDVESQGEVTPEVEAKEDPWEAAEEAFDSLEGGEVESEVEVKEPESHIEPEVPEYLKLDDLKVPHKYKDAVKERIQKVISDFETNQKTATEAVQQELGQHKEAVLGLVNVFKEILSTPKEQLPSKLAQYATKYGNTIGIDPSVVQNFSQPQNESPREVPQRVSVDNVVDKYMEALAAAQDPQKFAQTYKALNLEVAKIQKQETMDQVARILKAYHDKYVAPDKETLKEFKERSERQAETEFYNSTKGAWNEALDKVKAKHEDFGKYESKVSKLLKERKTLDSIRKSLNENPEDIEGREELIEQAYLLVSQQERIAAAKRPSQGGLPPTQKHIQTKKTGGGTWGDAWEETKHLYE